MRMQLTTCLLGVALASPNTSLEAQRDSVLAHRWVGTHLGRPLHFEFYADTMLVVNDRHVLDFRLTHDSLVSFGDTLVEGRYRFARGWLLFATPDGVVTMAKQSFLARPLIGRWTGPLGTDDEVMADLRMFSSGVAQWRPVPSGEWTVGEWERTFRIVTFTWEPDEDDTEDGRGEEEEEPEWRALYDPLANALLFEVTVTGSEPTILRRRLR